MSTLLCCMSKMLFNAVSNHCHPSLKGNTIPSALLGSDSQRLREAEVHHTLQNHHVPAQLPGPDGIFGGKDIQTDQITQQIQSM